MAATWVLLSRVGPQSIGAAWRVGAFWAALTVAFEFLAGPYLLRSSWPKLLADYNVAQGRIWLLVLITTFVAPALVYQFHP